jgi:hypothetical protein
MELPKSKENVSLEKIKEICKYYKRNKLWKRIEKNTPQKPFSSDGCSMWFDSWKGISIYWCCFLHDLEYWVGGDEVDRLIADAQLMIDVATALNETKMPQIMFSGVRVGGHESFRKRYSWGFGNKRQGLFKRFWFGFGKRSK